MKRLRFNGKSMSKFEMAFEMGYFLNLPWTTMCDALSYSDMQSNFIRYCVSKGLSYSIPS